MHDFSPTPSPPYSSPADRSRPVWGRYAVAVLTVAAAAALRWPLGEMLGARGMYSFMHPAVVVSACYGGFGPGIVTTVLGGLVADYLYEEPYYTLLPSNAAGWTILPLFILQGAVMSALCESLHRARRRAVRVAARLRQAKEQAEAAVGQAQAAAKDKEEFLAAVTHELRTPLQAILGWVRLSREQPDDGAAVEEALEVIERSARSQSRLVEDLLDVSRVATGRLRLNWSACDLASVVTAAMETTATAAQAKRVDVRSEFPDFPVVVRGDPQRLQQVVWNLLSNAVKFTPAGGAVQVRVRRRDQGAEEIAKGGSVASISVTDTGAGIDPAFLPHVFDRFVQAHDGATARRSGLGLGLAIVQQLVDLHGGEVEVDSAGIGRGTTFTVHLPLRDAAGFADRHDGSLSQVTRHLSSAAASG